jgi:hypothetical protein
MTPQQEKPMETTNSPRSAQGPSTSEAERRPVAARPGAFRVRYGRCAIAFVGLMCLLTGIVAGALRVFGVGSSWVPVGALLTGFMAVFLLRRLAVRDRRAKVNAAFRAAMAEPSTRPAVAPPLPNRVPAHDTPKVPDRPLFDAEADRPRIKPLTALELRQAALAEAAASGDNSVRAPETWGGAADGDASWEPVEVPKPTYVEAAKAERAAPEPLALPEAPKAVGKPSLKQGTAAAPPAAPPLAKPLTKAQSALSNLDDVLQRRRA